MASSSKIGRPFTISSEKKNLFFTVVLFLLLISCVIAKNRNYKERTGGNIQKFPLFEFSPILTSKKEKDGNISYEGLSADLLELLGNQLNITFKFVRVDPAEVSTYGLIVTLLRLLDRREVDMVPYFFEVVPDNLEHMDLMLFPMYIGGITLLQPWPAEQSRLRVLVRPFDYWTWICFLVSTVVFIGFCSVLLYFGKQSRYSIENIIYSQIKYVMTIITCQGNVVAYSAPTSFRLLVAPWLLVMVVIIYGYCGVLTALLAIPKLEPLVESLDDLVAQGKLRVTIEKKNVLTFDLLNATSGSKKIIGDFLRADPSLLFNDLFQMADNVINQRCAYFGAIEFANSVVREDYRANKKCRMTTSLKLMDFTMSYMYGFVKGNEIMAQDVNQFMSLHMMANGLTNRVKETYFPVTKECRVNTELKTIVKAVKLVDLMSSFVILGTGLGLSVMSFIWEIIKYHNQEN